MELRTAHLLREAAQPDFRTLLDDGLKAHPSLKDFKDINGLAQSFVDTQAMVARSVLTPTEDAAPEVWEKFYDKVQSLSNGKLVAMPDPTDESTMSAFRKAMGVPQGEDSYKVPEDVPAEYVDAIVDRLGYFKEIGLNQGQVDQIIHDEVKKAQDATAQSEAHVLENKAQLKKHWGINYEEAFNAGVNYMRQSGVPDKAIELFNDGRMAPDLAIWFMDQARRSGAEGATITHDTNNVPIESKDELHQRAAELRAKLTEMSPGDPVYQATLQRYQKVQEAALSEG